MPSKKRHYLTFLAKCSTLLSNETEPKSIEPNRSDLELFGEFDYSSDEFNSFYMSHNRQILLHWLHGRLWIEFIWIKFDDCVTYKQGLTLQLFQSVAKVQEPVHIANVQV